MSKDTKEQILPAGTILQDRYIIEKVRGKGGFGITYRAMDQKTQVKVAIKACVNKPGHAAGKARNEAAIMKSLKGLPGVVGVVDYFEENHANYIVMEYVSGVTVKNYIRENGSMKGKEVLEKMSPVLQAMERIHKKGIIHRDISPDNLMITRDGDLKLIDFGEAVKVEPKTEYSVLKNSGFAAVEQNSPQGKLGPWTDIYSLCATMYFMLTGFVPQDAASRWISDKIQPIDQAEGTGLGKGQCQALMKGMAIEKKNRYTSIQQLRKALYHKENVKTDPASGFTTTTGTYTLLRQYKNKKTPFTRWFVPGLLTAMILLVLVLAGTMILGGGDSGSGGVKTEYTQEQLDEHARIMQAIQNNKLDHILEDIEKLYPSDSDLSDNKKQNRFVLEINYYIKKGDAEGEQNLIDQVTETGEWLKYDRAIQDMIKEERQRLGTTGVTTTQETK